MRRSESEVVMNSKQAYTQANDRWDREDAAIKYDRWQATTGKKNAPQIPGWEPVSKADVDTKKGLYNCAQLVEGKWYIPKWGCDSLTMLVDEWLESVWYEYHACTYTWKDGSAHGMVSNGRDTIRRLKGFGLLDDDGRVIE